jgi:DNA segregation ATPase FtsK/SpoIIIE-like protein
VFPVADPDPDPGEAAAGTPGRDEAGDKALLQRLHAVAGRIQSAAPASNAFPTGVPARLAAVDDNYENPLFDDAVEVVLQWQRSSVHNLKQQLKISYNRATQLLKQMERAGVLSAPDEVGNRKVLKSPDQED